MFKYICIDWSVLYTVYLDILLIKVRTLCFRKPFLVIIVSFFPIKCYKYQAEICSISYMYYL